MPVLREQIEVCREPILRLLIPDDGAEAERFQTEDAMSTTLGLKVSASLYEIWSVSDMWHMAGGNSPPLATVSQIVGREVKDREFAIAIAKAVNEAIGYNGCRPLGSDRIRADGHETVATIVDELLNKRAGAKIRKSVVSSLKGS